VSALTAGVDFSRDALQQQASDGFRRLDTG
jgi:hypothetical protein